MTDQPQRCARDGCQSPAYTGNAISLQSHIGPLVIYVCAEHFAQWLHQTARIDTALDILRRDRTNTREEPTP